MKNLIAWLELKLGVDLDDTVWHYIIVFISALAVMVSMQFGQVTSWTVVGTLGGSLMNLGLWTIAFFGFMYFQYSTGRRVDQEIFDEHNLAVATFNGMVAIAMALLIAKGIL